MRKIKHCEYYYTTEKETLTDVALEYFNRLEKHNPEEMEKLYDRQYLRRTKRNY